MKRFATLAEYRQYLETIWDDYGACRSCGWHGLISEHVWGSGDMPEDSDYAQGFIEYSCVGEYASEGGHKGVRIPLPTSAPP